MTSNLLSVYVYSSDDAFCRIAPLIMRGQTTKIARASAENVTEAAKKIIQECVIRRRVGGAAVGIGRVDHRR